MSRDIAPFGLRMPPELREQIEKAARDNGRSMNAEIVARLSCSFEKDESADPDRLAELERRVARLESEIKK